MRHYIGIDNGVTGGITVLDELGRLVLHEKTPVKRCLSYTKKAQYLNRLDVPAFVGLLKPYVADATVVLERPATAGGRFNWSAAVSAIRCDEATQIALETLGVSPRYVDSREWQKQMLPQIPKPKAPRKPKKGAPAEELAAHKELAAEHKKKLAAWKRRTKGLSLDVGAAKFPGAGFKADADSALIAEWARLNRI